MAKNRKPKFLSVFICCAKEDLNLAGEIYYKLKNEAWIKPWLYVEDVLPGQEWQAEISKAMLNANAIIICLSKKTVKKEGYFQKEIKTALEIADEVPEGNIFNIPLKLTKCVVPNKLQKLNCLDYLDADKGYKILLNVLLLRAENLGLKTDNYSVKKVPDKRLASRYKDTNTPKKLATLILDEDINNFNSYRQESIRYILSRLLNVDESYIVIKVFSEGSVKVVIELPEDAYTRLASLVENRDKDLYRLFNLKSFGSLELAHAHKPVRVLQGLQRKFVGREKELNVIRQLVRNRSIKKRIALILGEGGIGKTKLLRRMLDEARAYGTLAAEEPIDFFSTGFRHIDGIQWKIKEIVENLPLVRAGTNPFLNFIKGKTDTSENFYECLKKFCAEYPLVLAFDTFENLDKVASDWLFKSDKGGLQVPGLICIVASRPEKNDLDLYRKNPLVEEVHISGFTQDEAEEFYQSISDEFGVGYADPLDDLLKAAGLSENDQIQNSVEWLREVTLGHPLRLEMAFRWSGTLLREDALKDLSADKFEERLMIQVRDLEVKELLDVGPLKVSQPVYDTLVCMAYVTRRFDEDFLRYLIEKRLVRLNRSTVTEKDILENLENYFFVKVRDGSGSKPVFQLHDEMARLVREYVWPFLDKAVEKKQVLLSVVIQYYDHLINEYAGESADILWVEKLYYTLQMDWKEYGKRLWFELASMDNYNISKFLPGEIQSYIGYYDGETKYQIYSELGRMERNAHHINQAIGYFLEAKILAQKEEEPLKLIKALESLASCYHPEKALRKYKEIRIICEQQVQERIPDAYYNIGFTYRRMQNIKMAIMWYKKAIDQFRMYPRSKGLQAKIENDLGYMYSIVGNWGKAKEAVGEGLRLRKEILIEYESEIKQKESDASQNRKGEKSVPSRLNLFEERRKAAYYLGLSYSTLGEIYRFQDDLNDASRTYTEAYTLFKQVSNEDWQARTLYSLGETNRRLAESNDLTEEERQEYIERAFENIEKSIYMCERYQLQDVDTANRIIGRLHRDLALYALKKDEIALAHDHLDKASLYFSKGLAFARDTHDVLEELENLTELAFIADDYMLIADQKNVSIMVQDYIDSFKKALDQHRNNKYRIYQFPVFESLYILKMGATYYRMGRYKEALDAYLKATIELATNPGYGQIRYKNQFNHLTRQIESLNSVEAEKWCRAFIRAWESTSVPWKRRRTLAQEVRPNMAIWCNKHLKKIGK